MTAGTSLLQTAFNCPVRQGYGLTETCASSCIGEACDSTVGIVGPPTTSTVIKLADWAEGNYYTKDSDDPVRRDCSLHSISATFT
jgi:long-chain acyl-CoA synthetase